MTVQGRHSPLPEDLKSRYRSDALATQHRKDLVAFGVHQQQGQIAGADEVHDFCHASCGAIFEQDLFGSDALRQALGAQEGGDFARRAAAQVARQFGDHHPIGAKGAGAAREAAAWHRKAQADADQNLIGEMRKRLTVVELSAQQIGVFREAMQPVYREWEGVIGADLMKAALRR